MIMMVMVDITKVVVGVMIVIMVIAVCCHESGG